MKLHISLGIHVVLDIGIPSRQKAKKLHYWDRILESTHTECEANSYTVFNTLKLTE